MKKLSLKKYSIALLIGSVSCLQAQNIGINTSNPTKTLDINGELRIRVLPPGNSGQQIIVSDQQGNILKMNLPAALPQVGDIKDGYTTTDHEGWYLLDGRALTSLSSTAQTNAATIGFTGSLPNFSGKYARTGETGTSLSTIGGIASYNLTKANMPNFAMTAIAALNGDHNHGTSDIRFGQLNLPPYAGLWGYTGPIQLFAEGKSTSTSLNHTHTVSLNSNGGGQPISLSPAYIALNTFVYLGN
jgi:hypothetical protein